jgi:alkaline phosphatase D
MKISRRDFLQDSLIKTVGAAAILNNPFSYDFLNLNSNFQGLYRGALAVMQGLATKTTSQFIILTPIDRSFGYAVVDSFGKILPVKITNRETRNHSRWGIEKILVSNLKINSNYTLKVIDPNSGQVIDERLFKSLNTDLKTPRLMIASCMKDHKEDKREEMWDLVAAQNPDMIFLIGDTCYSDHDCNGSDADYWRRFVETRSLLSHFRQKTLIPTLAIWDDHDFAGNNADSSFPKKSMTKQLFKIFWDNEPQEKVLLKGPGVSQIFSAFGQRFFMMDCRYFRSPREQQENPVHWGSTQEDFLFENLAKSKAPTWLMNGSQFFGGYLKKDAFEYWHLQNFKNICGQLTKYECPIAFASGDVHFTEYMKIEPEVLGYSTFEITSSSIHSTTIPFNHLRKTNPRRIDANSSHQFTIVATSHDPKTGWVLAAESFKSGMKRTLQNTMIIKR